MTDKEKNLVKGGSSAYRQESLLSFTVAQTSSYQPMAASLHIMRDALFVSAGVDVMTVDKQFLAGALQHGAVRNACEYSRLGACKTTADFYSSLQQSRFLKYQYMITNHRLARFCNYLAFLFPDFDFLALYMFTPCALKLNMDAWKFDSHVGAIPAFCPACREGKPAHYDYLLTILREMDNHMFFPTEMQNVVYDTPPGLEEPMMPGSEEQLKQLAKDHSLEGDLSRVYELAREDELVKVPFTRLLYRVEGLPSIPLNLSRGKLRLITVMVEDYDDFRAQGFKDEANERLQRAPMHVLSHAEMKYIAYTRLLTRSVELTKSSLELSRQVRRLIELALEDYDFERHSRPLNTIDIRYAGAERPQPAPTVISMTQTDEEYEDIPALVDDDTPSDYEDPDNTPLLEESDDPERVRRAMSGQQQFFRGGAEDDGEGTSIVRTGVPPPSTGSVAEVTPDERSACTLERGTVGGVRDDTRLGESKVDVPKATVKPNISAISTATTSSEPPRQRSQPRHNIPTYANVVEQIQDDDPDFYRVPEDDDERGEPGPTTNWQVAQPARVRKIQRNPVMVIKQYRTQPLLSHLYQKELVFKGPAATAIDPDIVMKHPRDTRLIRFCYDDEVVMNRIFRYVKRFDRPPEVSNFDIAVRQGTVPYVEKFARFSAGCEHYCYLLQWQHRCLFQHTHMTGCSFGDLQFDLKCPDHGLTHAWEWLEFVFQSILTYRNIDPQVKRTWLEQLFSLPVVIALLRDPPKNMTTRVNWLRRFLGMYRDEGYQAQGGMASVSGFFSYLKELPIKSYEAVCAALKKVSEFLVSIFTSMVQLPGKIPDLTRDLVTSVVDGYLKKIFEPLAPVARWTQKHTGVVLASIEAIVVAILLHFEYISIESAKAIVGCSALSAIWAKVFTAQSESPLTTVMMLLTGVFYMLRPTHIQVIRDRLSQLSLIMTTAGMLSSTASFIFMLLPEAIRMSLKYTFGGSRAIMSEQVSEWRAKVATANRLSTCSDVLISADFGNLVKDIMASGMELLRTSTGQDRQSVMTMLPSMMRLDNMLYRYQLDSKDRNIPFVLHLAGPPGVGKTLLVRLILNRLGYSKTDLYFRPLNSEYWDGYAQQKVIVYDEFLVGDEGVENMAKEFMMLASTAHFLIPAASIDDPSVGIKGQYAKPEMIITISNATYPAHPSLDRNALDRRRSEVVRFEFSERAFKKSDNTVDLSAHTAEQIEAAVWVDCYVWPPQPTTRRVRSPPMTFDQLMEHLELTTRQHREVVEKLNTSNVVVSTDETPAQKINKAMAEINGIPSGPVNLFSFFMRSPGFTAQGFQTMVSEMSDPPAFLTDWIDEEEPDYHAMQVAEVENSATPWWKYLFGAVSVSVGMYLLVKLVRSFFSKEDATVEFFPQASGEPRSRKKHKRKQRANWGGEDSSSEGAPVKVELVFGDRRMTALPLKERMVLTYAHGLKEISRDGPTVPVIVIVNGVSYPATIVWSTVKTDYDNDLAIIDLESNKLPQFANMINKMLSEADLGLITDLPVVLTVMRAGQPVSLFTLAKYVTNRSYTSGETSITLDAAFTYQADTQNGDCGGYLMVRSGPLIGKIIGMHVAGRADSVGLNFGLAVALTKDLVNAAFEKTVEGSDPGEAFFESQNDIEVQQLQPDQVVYLPTRSKLKPSCVSSLLNFPTRVPSLLDPEDPRNVSGLNPVDVFIERLHPVLPEVDMDIVDAVQDAMLAEYENGVHVHERWRILSFEEAIKGIPGKMTSINLDSSIGLPLLKFTNKRKRDFIVMDEEHLLVDDELRTMVDSFMQQVQEVPQESHWVGYLKDELVKPSKVEEARTRVIYCGDVVATIAFRRYFGTVLLNIQQSRETLPHAIGYNPYSYDMNEMHQYLSSVGNQFVAGDYKSFDNNQHPVFRRLAYNILRHFMRKIDGVSEKLIDHFVRHQTQGYVQIADRLFYQSQGHFSGCMFTSLINCLVNEAYIRYCFVRQCPGLYFDSNVRLKVLGDDHIICVAKGVDFGFSAIQSRMRELGQVYTSDTKEEACSEFRPFGELTFLGAQPVKFRGQWTGKLLKRIIQQTLMWTRDNDQSYEQVAVSMLEYSAIHGTEYYEWLHSRVRRAYAFCGLTLPVMPPVSEIQQIVVARTAGSGTSFVSQGDGFAAQGDVEENPVDSGAVGEIESVAAPLQEVGMTGMRRVAFSEVNGRSITDRQIPQTLSVDQALESRIMRHSFPWTTDQPVGTVLWSTTVPQGLLGSGSTEAIQNMPFKNYAYWRGDVEVALQINGNPFQQGLLCAYFYPLSTRGHQLNIINWTQTQHLMIRPGNSSVVTMRIPFRYPRSYIQLTGTTLPGDDLGMLVVGVFSPLLSTGWDSVTVTIYSAFLNSEFRIPRPLGWKTSGRSWEAQGNLISTVNNRYDISNVAGSVGAQSDGHLGSAELSMPLDDPPLAGGSVPVQPIFSSMSKVVGLEPTVPLQLHPIEGDRHHRQYFDPSEQSIPWIMDLPFVLKRFTWNHSDATGARKMAVHFDSFMGHEHNDAIAAPASLAILNMFTYWHADLHLTVVAVKTPYQSGRLRFVMAYGADCPEVTPLSYDNSTCFFNETLDFSDNDTVEFDVPYVAATEFLRTRDGVDAAIPPTHHYYSCGYLACFVVNPLKLVSATVASSIEVVIFARMRNVQLAVPRNIPLAAPQSYDVRVSGTEKTRAAPEAEFVAQGLVTHQTEPTLTPCVLNIGQKFEYRVTNVLDVARRMVPVEHTMFDWEDYNNEISTDSDYMPPRVRTIKVCPSSIFNAFYAAWAGTLRYRIYAPKGVVFSTVTFVPVPLWYQGHRHYPTDNAGGTTMSTDVTSRPALGHYSEVHVRGVSSALMGPQEILAPVSGDKEWIDVTVPFCSNFHYQVNPSRKRYEYSEGFVSTYTGVLEFGFDVQRFRVFQCVGDDFDFGIWRPPLDITWTNIQGARLTGDYSQSIGGLIF